MKHSRFFLVATLLLALSAGAWSAEYDSAAMTQPVPAKAKFSDPDYYIWCATMVRGDDGKCHLLFEDGRPAVLLFASTDSDTNEHSFNVRIPLRTP